MKILVFDDNATNCNAAQAQLQGHDLTVVGTYDEAQELVRTKTDYDKAKQLIAEGVEYGEAYKQTKIYPDFDVVLVDLLVPASAQSQGGSGMNHVGKELPLGVFIGLLAAKNGVKKVAVFTDSDHHSHPASACFDCFNEGECEPTSFAVGGGQVMLSNTRNWVDYFDPQDLGTALKYEEYDKRADKVRAKNWKSLLEYLLR